MDVGNRDSSSPGTFDKTDRGGIRKYYLGHWYMLDNHGARGEEYYRCMNYRSGCKGRMKISPKGGTMVSRPHFCEPTAKNIMGRKRQLIVQKAMRPPPVTTYHPVALRPQEPPTSFDEDDFEDAEFEDEADETTPLQPDVSEALAELQTSYIRQKMEIGALMKQKLQLEVALLQSKFQRAANPSTSAVQSNLITSASVNRTKQSLGLTSSNLEHRPSPPPFRI